MAMGRWRGERQGTLFIETEKLARSEGRTFYTALNELLSGHDFDRFCEPRVSAEKVFDETIGRPSIPLGVYFRMLLVGYFEGVASERGIAWRCADSLNLREFLGYELTETTPDHSTLSGLRRKLGLPLHRAVFDWVLDVAAREGILKGRRVGVDSTMLQANASMKTIVRRCDGVSYRKYLEKLAKAEGIENPTNQDLQRLDRNRPDKKVSNRIWKSKTDKDARIAKMKNGSTRMAYKAEHAVDVDSGVTVAAEVHGADQGDPATIAITAWQANEAFRQAGTAGGRGRPWPTAGITRTRSSRSFSRWASAPASPRRSRKGTGRPWHDGWAKRRCGGCKKPFAATTGGYAAQPGAPFRS